jgi:hypothetical protein
MWAGRQRARQENDARLSWKRERLRIGALILVRGGGAFHSLPLATETADSSASLSGHVRC